MRDIIRQAGKVQSTRQIRDRATSVSGQDIENPRNAWRKAADRQRLIEENSSNLGTFEQLLQIAVGVVLCLDVVAELSIDSVQLFIHRRQFLLGSFQLL